MTGLRRLPTAVLAGCFVFAGLAALALVTAVGAFFAIPEFRHVGRGWGEGGPELATFGLVAYALLTVVVGGLCVLLAILAAPGRHWVRVLIWVLGGLAVCWSLGLLVLGGYDPVPWHASLTRGVASAMLLFAAGAITLLALPSSHRYFQAARKARTPPPPRQPPPMTGRMAWGIRTVHRTQKRSREGPLLAVELLLVDPGRRTAQGPVGQVGR